MPRKCPFPERSGRSELSLRGSTLILQEWITGGAMGAPIPPSPPRLAWKCTWRGCLHHPDALPNTPVISPAATGAAFVRSSSTPFAFRTSAPDTNYHQAILYTLTQLNIRQIAIISAGQSRGAHQMDLFSFEEAAECTFFFIAIFLFFISLFLLLFFLCFFTCFLYLFLKEIHNSSKCNDCLIFFCNRAWNHISPANLSNVQLISSCIICVHGQRPRLFAHP